VDVKPTLARQVIGEHFGESVLADLITSRRQFAAQLLPDLQTALISEVFQFQAAVYGIHQEHQFLALDISRLLAGGTRSAEVAPLQFQDIDVGEDEPFAGLNNGLWLFRVHEQPIAVLLSKWTDPGSKAQKFVQIEIAHLEASSEFKRQLLWRLAQAGETSKLYRGKTLSFESGSDYSGMRSDMLVHRLPPLSKDEVILDERTLRRVDRHVFEFDAHREDLRRFGQSTRKGILLYGPPGTGKTHLVRYISSNLPNHTTLLLTAEQVSNLTAYFALARALQPSILVLEDVDLVGRSRESMRSPGTEILLNRLLNEMDGLKPDADMLFILTTNRPEDIEPALASRPGRIDAAIEVALPDERCRARLIELYGRALSFEEGAVDDAAQRTEGASAAFMKELVRRLAQRSLAAGRDGTVSRDDVTALIDEGLEDDAEIGSRLSGMGAAPRRRAAPPNC